MSKSLMLSRIPDQARLYVWLTTKVTNRTKFSISPRTSTGAVGTGPSPFVTAGTVIVHPVVKNE